MKIHHIGYMVKHLDASVEDFIKLGYKCISSAIFDESRDSFIALLTLSDVTVELVSPASENSVVYGLLKRCKNAPYHICYEVGDDTAEKGDPLLLTIKEMENNGYVLFLPPMLAPALGKNKRVAFLMNSNIGMIELIDGDR